MAYSISVRLSLTRDCHFRGDAKHRTRNLEILRVCNRTPEFASSRHPGMTETNNPCNSKTSFKIGAGLARLLQAEASS
jgi:hypothetical protein